MGRVSQSVESYRINMACKKEETRYVLRSVKGCNLVVQPREIVIFGRVSRLLHGVRYSLGGSLLRNLPEAASGKRRPVCQVAILLGQV
jgi:hypothetical protein